MDRLTPGFVKPKQVRRKREYFPQVEVEIFHMSALSEFDLTPQ